MYIFSMKRASSGLSNCDLTAVLVSTLVDFLCWIYFCVFLFELTVFYVIYFLISSEMWSTFAIFHLHWFSETCANVQCCAQLGYNDFDIFWENEGSGPDIDARNWNLRNRSEETFFRFLSRSVRIRPQSLQKVLIWPTIFFSHKIQYD